MFKRLGHYTAHKKVKWFLYTPWRRFGWEEVQFLLSLNLGTRKGWVVTITPRRRFTPGKRAPGTRFVGGWVGPRAILDPEVGVKILRLCRGLNPVRSIRSQTPYWLSYPGFLHRTWLAHILDQASSVYTITPCFIDIYFNIILSYLPGFCNSSFRLYFHGISHLSHVWFVSFTPHTSWLEHIMISGKDSLYVDFTSVSSR
jgi:hypothetical protein